MSRFKNRKDLYVYFEDRLGIWLPACKISFTFSSFLFHQFSDRYCPLEHLQKILRGEKKAVHVDKVPKQLLNLPNWPELSSEVLMTQGFLSKEIIEAYLPSPDHKKVDRRFILGVFGATNKEMALEYYQATYDAKMRSRLPVVKVKTLDISDEWLDKLLEYEVPPSK
jgi:hypothetical protein